MGTRAGFRKVYVYTIAVLCALAVGSSRATTVNFDDIPGADRVIAPGRSGNEHQRERHQQHRAPEHRRPDAGHDAQVLLRRRVDERQRADADDHRQTTRPSERHSEFMVGERPDAKKRRSHSRPVP